jgi:hypothetical protein
VTNFLLLLLFGVFWTWGIHAIFAEGYILEKPGNWIRKHFPSWIEKPLIGCPPCQASFHGVFIYVTFNDWFLYPMLAYVICLCGVNFIIKERLYGGYD